MSNQQICLKWWRLVLCAALLAAGCTTVANPTSCADGFCHDPALPFCDVDGTIGGGQRLTCIAVSCTPLEFEACRGDEAIVCNTTGDDYDITHCAGGCSAAGGGCMATHIIPRYLPTVCDYLAALPELVISESMTVDTTTGDTCRNGLIEQKEGSVHVGPAICVLRYGTITVAPNQTLSVTGRHAIALVADGALTINGVLDISANGSTNGPGGGFQAQETAANTTWPAAPGGAGFNTPGGPGGNASTDGGALNGGAAINPALIVPFLGGARPAGFSAGGGGGAATLISCREAVSVAGIIDAGGGGGYGGYPHSNGVGDPVMPNGGGAGGNIVLQGMNVSVTGQVFANGGGGGAGSSVAGVTGASGADGTRSAMMSAPGGASQNGEGAGGAGGRAEAPPGPGKKPTTSGFGAGAGGGSTGFIQTYTPAGVVPTLTPAVASPTLQPNRTVETR